MKKIPRISSAEWAVMRAIWDEHPISAAAVASKVAEPNQWSPRTVKTLVDRLVKKGALSYKREGRAYLFYPKVAEEDCVRAESRSFLERVFGGALTPMLAHFIEAEDLSGEELAQLRQLLEQKGE